MPTWYCWCRQEFLLSHTLTLCSLYIKPLLMASLSTPLPRPPICPFVTMGTSPLPSLILLLTLTSSLTLSSSSSSFADTGNTLHIIQCLPSPSSSSFADLLSRDTSRLSFLSSSLAAHRAFAPIASGSSVLHSSSYLVRVSLGSPPQDLLAALDTSSDAAWFPSSAFSPARSSSFKPLPCSSPQCRLLPSPSCPAPACSFNFTYGTSAIAATLATDTLSLASDAIESYTFAAVISSNGTSAPPQGLIGLGRGPLSLLSQTKPLYSSTFSYCLPSFRSANFSGTLRLGVWGQPLRIRTTPLLSNPHRRSLYYVNLLRIRVGRRWVTIPDNALAFDPSTGAGTIIDSGTTFTRLVAPAYAAVRDEFRRRVKQPATSLGGFDTCYHGTINVPTITLGFEGMNVTLGAENVMIHSSSGDLQCLAMAAAPENVNSVVNVIASWQQQNHRVLVDGGKGRVGIAREMCTRA